MSFSQPHLHPIPRLVVEPHLPQPIPIAPPPRSRPQIPSAVSPRLSSSMITPSTMGFLPRSKLLTRATIPQPIWNPRADTDVQLVVSGIALAMLVHPRGGPTFGFHGLGGFSLDVISLKQTGVGLFMAFLTVLIPGLPIQRLSVPTKGSGDVGLFE